MPSVRITNYTSRPLNVSLKHLCALHFENGVQPGQTIKLTPGKVWFTLEVLVDDEKNRYSVAGSAACIAIVSIAAVATAATAAVPLVGAGAGAAVGGVVSGAVTGIGSAIVSTSTAAAAGLGAAITSSSAFLATHGVTAAKLSAAFLPKAIEVVEKEVGGFNKVQKEVVTILSNPNVTEEVRSNGLNILARLADAVAADRKEKDKDAGPVPHVIEKDKHSVVKSEKDHAKSEKDHSKAKKEKSKERQASSGTLNSEKDLPPPPPYSDDKRPTLKRVQTTASQILERMTPDSKADRKAKKEAKEEASWEVLEDPSGDPDSTMLSKKECLRVHGLFVGERKSYEVHEKEGKLVLICSFTRETIS